MGKQKKVARDYKLITAEENNDYIEGISQLQSNIDLSSIDQKIKVIGITSARQDEGKSTLACNLANVYGAKGNKVLIIDLDLRRPTVHRFFQVERENGVVEFCANGLKFEDVVKSSGSVDVITAGEKTPFPGQIISSQAFAKLIEEARKRYDYVVVDNPPVLVINDAAVAGHLLDGFVVVTRHKASKYSELKEVVKLLKENDLNLIGCTMVDFHQSKNRYGYGYNYHYYGGQYK